MIFRFRRTMSVAPGVRLGVSWSPKRGLGATSRVGSKHVGASYSTKKGAYVGGAIPGSGLSIGTYLGGPKLPVGPLAIQSEGRAPKRSAAGSPPSALPAPARDVAETPREKLDWTGALRVVLLVLLGVSTFVVLLALIAPPA